ncbi:MAG: hypothetical protein V5A72_03030 [Candidatus Nanohaloarchaea archaeon]
MSKGSNLPINSSAVIVLIIMVLVVVFGIVSTVVNDEKNKLFDLEEKYRPDDPTSSSFEHEEGPKLEKVSKTGFKAFDRGVKT